MNRREAPALLLYRSQMLVIGRFLLAFGRSNELFLEGEPASLPSAGATGERRDGGRLRVPRHAGRTSAARPPPGARRRPRVAVAAMILVNNPGDWSAVFPPLLHADWNGWTFADAVFPFFVFVMGCAMPFTFARRNAGGSVACAGRSISLTSTYSSGDRMKRRGTPDSSAISSSGPSDASTTPMARARSPPSADRCRVMVHKRDPAISKLLIRGMAVPIKHERRWSRCTCGFSSSTMTRPS